VKDCGLVAVGDEGAAVDASTLGACVSTPCEARATDFGTGGVPGRMTLV